MSDLTMKELLEQDEQKLNELKKGDIIEGTIIKIYPDKLALDINNSRFDGVMPLEQAGLYNNEDVSDVYKIGETVKGVITGKYDKDGVIVISKLELDKEDNNKEVISAFEEKKILTVSAVKCIPRGIIAKYKTQNNITQTQNNIIQRQTTSHKQHHTKIERSTKIYAFISILYKNTKKKDTW